MNANAPVSGAERELLLGCTRDTEEFRVSSHRLAQFAAAVNDENPRHLAGEFAPPVFAHVPVMQSMVEVLNQATNGLVLHGEHDFLFHGPIVPGQRLFSKSMLVGVRGNRAGVTYIIRSDTFTHTGESVCTQFSSCLLRGEPSSLAEGEPLPERPVTAKASAERTSYPLAGDQTRRYADAARDYSPYTMDPAAAAKAGFPAPLVHGMCTLALASRSIVDRHCAGETPRLKRLGCRFAYPLLLTDNQAISVEHWSSRDGLVGFEAADKDGNLVIKNGYAQVVQ